MSPDPTKKYFTACRNGRLDDLRQFLDDGLDPNTRDMHELTGLIYAGRKGQLEVAKMLIEAGAELEASDVRNRTALFHAVCFKKYDVTKFMIEKGANINQVDTHDWTPLDMARSTCSKKMIELLEQHGAEARQYKA